VDAAIVDADDARAWLEAIDGAFAAGEFMFAFVQFAVIGRVPG
jgi:hypothetical protein